MDRKSGIIFNCIVFISLAFTLISVLSSNTSDKLPLLILSCILAASFIFRRTLPKQEFASVPVLDGRRIMGIWKWALILSIFLDISLICGLCLTDRNDTSQLLFYILVADIMIIDYSAFSLFISAGCYVAFITILFYRYDINNFFSSDYFIPIALNKSFFFIFVFGVAFTTRSILYQKSLLDKTAEELRTKTVELQHTNKSLQDAMNALEEITALKERNRIAHEIHDTLGHTLTTALVEIDAGMCLYDKKPSKAVQKLILARDQVKKGLEDIRKSVRALQEGSNVMSFIPSLYSLVQNTELHTDTSVKCLFSQLPELDAEVEKAIYGALQEGLTNGIRHGKCTGFVCTLKYENCRIIFTLQDNGVGCEEIEPGYGLTVMKERIEKLGGTLGISSSQSNGCLLEITIPYTKDVV